MYSIWHQMLKIASASGVPRPRWGSLRRSPIPPSRYGLLAFGNRSFAPSALAIPPPPPPPPSAPPPPPSLPAPPPRLPRPLYHRSPTPSYPLHLLTCAPAT